MQTALQSDPDKVAEFSYQNGWRFEESDSEKFANRT